MTPTVVIVLDAFRGDYISPSETPFLHEMSNRSVFFKEVEPSPGFCERSEIFSGKSPLESGYFTAIGYDPVRSPYRYFKYLSKFVDLITLGKLDSKVNRFFRKSLNRVAKQLNIGMGTYRIPLSDLHRYRLTEDEYSQLDERSFGPSSLIQLFSKYGSVYLDSFTSLRDKRSKTDDERIASLLACQNQHVLYLLYISSADTIGHKYGPASTQQRQNISNIDAKIKTIYDKFSDECNIVIIGDHGMAPVEAKINVENELKLASKELGLELGRDFTYFLDSTMCRIWFHSQNVEARLVPYLTENYQLRSNGVFIASKDYNEFGIPNSKRLYGDFLWACNVGGLIWPDFFHNDHKNPPIGMHGYLADSNSLKGFCTILTRDGKKEIHKRTRLVDLYKHIVSYSDV